MTQTATLAETVLVSLEAGVLTLTLNRPDKLNSFNEAMHLALRAGFQRATEDPDVRAVLLTGSGRGFCAGQDLGDRDPRKGDAVPDLGATLETFYNPTLRLMRALGKPVVSPDGRTLYVPNAEQVTVVDTTRRQIAGDTVFPLSGFCFLASPA